MKRFNWMVIGIALWAMGPWTASVSAEEDEHGHDHGDEHGEEVAPANVGPDKGMLSFSEKEGFELSPEATRTFGLRSEAVKPGARVSVAASAIVRTNGDTSVYRLRADHYKRVAVKIERREGDRVQLISRHLTDGDQVVIHGASFLRVAELDATSGESGHHH